MDPKLPNQNVPPSQPITPTTLTLSHTTITPQPIPPTTVFTQTSEPETKPKRGCFKKILIGFLILVVIIIIGVVSVIFLLPKALNLTSKDITPIDDQDLQRSTTKIPDETNAYLDLQNIDSIVYEPKEVADYITIKKWDDKDIAQILVKNKDAFAKFDSSVQKTGFQDPKYLAPITSSTFTETGNIYSGIQKVARLNVLRGLNEVKNNKPESFDDLYKTISIGQKMEHQGGSIIVALIGTTLKNIGIAGVQTAIGKVKFPHQTSIAINSNLDKFDYDPNGLTEGFKYEYAKNLFVIDALENGKIDEFMPSDSSDSASTAERKIYSSINKFNFEPNNTKKLYADYYRAELAYAQSPCDKLKVPQQPQKFLNPPTAPYTENGLGKLMFGIGTTIFSNLVTSKCYETADLNFAKLLAAISSYQTEKGTLPTSLDLLVPTYITEIPKDPFDGGQMKYSATNKVIYSVGRDKKDDGGKSDTHSQGAPDYIFPIKF